MLARAVERGGSDLHLKVDSPPMARIDGELAAIDERSLTDGDLEAVMTVVTERTPAKREHFYTSGDLDTAYMAEDVGRFRVNGFRQRGPISFAFRYVSRRSRTSIDSGSRSGFRTSPTCTAVSSAETAGRLIEFFPAAKQLMVRQILAGVLRGGRQPAAPPKIGGGRIAAVEVMVNL